MAYGFDQDKSKYPIEGSGEGRMVFEETITDIAPGTFGGAYKEITLPLGSTIDDYAITSVTGILPHGTGSWSTPSVVTMNNTSYVNMIAQLYETGGANMLSMEIANPNALAGDGTIRVVIDKIS